jgi:hypothetical protein
MSETTVSPELQQKVDETIVAWEDEASLWQGWRDVPEMLGMSRRRLPRLIELNAPDHIIETEIEFTHTRIAQMREIRMKGLH